jgi:hypothetical protein
LIEPPGSQPDSPLSEFSGFVTVHQTLTAATPHALMEVPGLRETVFREALFMLHKASHVIGCAETQVRRGAKTWPMSEAYHGAYFAAKAISYLLGVAIVDFRDHIIVVDIWPADKGRSRSLILSSPSDTSVDFDWMKVVYGHYQLWQLFQRLLELTTVDVWPRAYVTALSLLSTHDFAKQRNVLHYQDDAWIFDDLFEFVVEPTFGVHRHGLHRALVYDEKSDFSLVLALVLFRLAYLLFDSITQVTNKLTAEKNMILNRLRPHYHPLYLVHYP